MPNSLHQKKQQLGLHILVVDDNVVHRRMSQAILGNAGYQVTLAENGRAALCAYMAANFDLILLDVHMPDMDGYEVCRRLRGLPKGEEIPIVFLTDTEDVAASEIAVESGADDLLNKPIKITELLMRVRSLLRIKQSEARLRAILNNMTEGLITYNGAGVIESMNPAAEALFGDSEKAMVGQPIGVLFPSREDPAAPSGKSSDSRPQGSRLQTQGVRKGGGVFPVEQTMFSFPTAAGMRYAVMVEDLTKELEVERIKKEFVSTVSHELRTPLTSIRGSLGLLAAGILGELSPDAQETVEIAQRNTIRLISLINDILDIDKLEQGKIELVRDIHSLRDIASRSIESLKSFAADQGITIEQAVPELKIYGDGDRLVQVLVNFLANAVKFSPSGSAVTVTAVPIEHEIEISVKDRGRGVPPEFQKSIFERFQQVESSDSRQKGGTGLGLAICKAIVELHGGTIGLTSQLGAGSTFFFRIPLHATAAARMSAK